MVVGHRGVPRLHQENTLAGFRRARALGVPAVELDVILSADGVPVVFHDVALARLTGAVGTVATSTWDQLARLRVQRALSYRGVDGAPVVLRYAREEPIARLDEVLAELGTAVAINIEIKVDPARWWTTAVATRTAEVIAAAGVTDTVIVTSFDPRKLVAARRAHPALRVGFCFDDTMLDVARPLLGRLPLPSRVPGGDRVRGVVERLLVADLAGRALGTPVVGAEHTLVGPSTVAALHRRGVAIGTHTLFPLGTTTAKPVPPAATTDAEARRLIALGVDWIETDDPERLLALL